MSLFIVFEGGEGSGKSTQAKALCTRLRKKKYAVFHTQEPGGTAFGRFLRNLVTLHDGGLIIGPKEPSQLLLMSPHVGDYAIPEVILGPTTARSELLYFLLSRAQLVSEVIQPCLSRGITIICDRYAPSSIAYQGYGRGLDIKLIETANDIATQGLKPDLIILLDLLPEEGLERKKETTLNRLDQEEVAFYQRVREGYLVMAAADPQRWLVVDARLPKREVSRIIWAKIEELLQKER